MGIPVRSRTWTRVGISVLIGAATLVNSQGALAEHGLQLDFLAFGCSHREDFEQQLLARSRYPGSLVGVRIRVRMTSGGLGYIGRFELTDPRGNHVERELTGKSCSEVSSALALAIVVTVEGAITPDGSHAVVLDKGNGEAGTLINETPDQSDGSNGASGAPALAAPDDTDRKGSGDAAQTNIRPSAEAKVGPRESISLRVSQPERLPPQSSHGVALGTVGGMHSAIAPSITPTLGLEASHYTPRVWGTSVYRLEALFGWSRSVPVSIGDTRYGAARFYWMATRWLACPLVRVSRGLSVGPCGMLELGVLRGLGSGEWGSLASNGWWFAPGASLEGAVALGVLQLQVTGGAVVPIRRDRFKFAERPEIFRAPGVGLVAEVGIGWLFE